MYDPNEVTIYYKIAKRWKQRIILNLYEILIHVSIFIVSSVYIH